MSCCVPCCVKNSRLSESVEGDRVSNRAYSSGRSRAYSNFALGNRFHTGLRFLFLETGLAPFIIPRRTKYISPGKGVIIKQKHKDFKELGCDVISYVSGVFYSNFLPETSVALIDILVGVCVPCINVVLGCRRRCHPSECLEFEKCTTCS